MDPRRRLGAGRPRNAPSPTGLSADAPARHAPRIDLDDVIYGVHAVDEMLVAGEPLKRLHIGDDRKRDPALRNLLEHAREAGVQVRFESRVFFASFPYKAHQGVVAFGAPFEYLSLDEAIALRRKDRPSIFVLLDHVTDPHNVGAIVRSVESAGGTALILPDRRSAGVNATVRKSSAGATAYLPIARVANVANAIRTMKKARIWVYGAALGPETQDYTDVDYTGDICFVIGAEGEGLSPLVQRECDGLVGIPMLGRLQSLNASVATGVLLYEAVRQRKIPPKTA